MKKKDVLKSKLLFNEIIQKGDKLSNKYFIIYSMRKEIEFNNYGIAVGKKVGNAVIRNKIKRQIRNIITKNYILFPNYHNYIIICKKEILNLSYKEKEDNLIELLNKGEKHEK